MHDANRVLVPETADVRQPSDAHLGCTERESCPGLGGAQTANGVGLKAY